MMDSKNLVEIRDLAIGFGDVTMVEGSTSTFLRARLCASSEKAAVASR
ncbi:MAG: hypothetical protein MO852_01170 [Candidatus Devosia euplotis]|nr:hypothetical protein [Candidatus Devosia euplotis]